MNSYIELVDQARSKVNYIDFVKLVYAIKAWEVLSENNIIQDNDLCFDTFYRGKIEAGKLKIVFGKLKEQHKIFDLYLRQGSRIENMDDNYLIEIFHFISKKDEIPKVNDAFYNVKNNLQSYTVSAQVAEFGMALLDSDTPVYVPFTQGFAYAYYSEQKIYAENQIALDELVAELVNVIDGMSIEFHLHNPLENPSFINPDAPHLLLKYKSVLSCPPFGLKGRLNASEDKYGRFQFHKGSNLDVAHFEHILAQTEEKAVVLMPVGFTYRPGVEASFRQYLVENNLLDAIIQFPPNLHSATAIESTYFVINKHKTDRKVHFINLKLEAFLTKKGRQITIKNIANLAKIYHEREDFGQAARLVDVEEIKKNNYLLAIDRYIAPEKVEEAIDKIHELVEAGVYNRLVRLGEISIIKRSQLFTDEEEGLEVKEVSPSDFPEAGFITGIGKIKKLKEQEKKYQTYKLQPWDILLSTKGTIGKVAIVGEITEPMIASQAIHIIRSSDFFEHAESAIVLYMYLKSDVGQMLLKHLVLGTAMPQISTSELKALLVPDIQDEDMIQEYVDRFYKEVDLQGGIDQLKNEIDEIHKNFLEIKR